MKDNEFVNPPPENCIHLRYTIKKEIPATGADILAEYYLVNQIINSRSWSKRALKTLMDRRKKLAEGLKNAM